MGQAGGRSMGGVKKRNSRKVWLELRGGLALLSV